MTIARNLKVWQWGLLGPMFVGGVMNSPANLAEVALREADDETTDSNVLYWFGDRVIDPADLELLIFYPDQFYECYYEWAGTEDGRPDDGSGGGTTRYRCEGCRDKNGVMYECYHETMDPNGEPCDTTRCIKNEIFAMKSCCADLERGTVSDCRVLTDLDGAYARQVVIELPPGQRCSASNPNPNLWMLQCTGCPGCAIVFHERRCNADENMCGGGRVVDSALRPGRNMCSEDRCQPQVLPPITIPRRAY